MEQINTSATNSPEDMPKFNCLKCKDCLIYKDTVEKKLLQYNSAYDVAIEMSFFTAYNRAIELGYCNAGLNYEEASSEIKQLNLEVL